MSSIYDEGWAEERRETSDFYLGEPGWDDPDDDPDDVGEEES